MIQYVCFLCRNAKTIEYKLCWGNFRSFWKVWFPNYRNHPVHSPHSSTPPLAWAMESHQPGSLRWAPPQTTIDLFLEGLLSIGLKPLNHHRSGQYQCTSHENTLTLRRPTSTQIQEYHIYIHQIFIHGISWGGPSNATFPILGNFSPPAAHLQGRHLQRGADLLRRPRAHRG